VCRVKNCREQLIRGVIGTELFPDTINRMGGFFLSRSWKPLIYTLKEKKVVNISKIERSLHCHPCESLKSCMKKKIYIFLHDNTVYI
jgi:hypothetical protein